jgi:hypothetical protein
MKPTAPFITMRPISEHRTLVTFPNGRKGLRPHFRRNRPLIGALRRRASWKTVAIAFAFGMVCMWALASIIAPFIDNRVLGVLGN